MASGRLCVSAFPRTNGLPAHAEDIPDVGPRKAGGLADSLPLGRVRKAASSLTRGNPCRNIEVIVGCHRTIMPLDGFLRCKLRFAVWPEASTVVVG